MRIHTYFKYGSLFAAFMIFLLVFVSCQETELVGSRVQFQSETLRINTTASASGEVLLSIEPAAPTNTQIEITIDGRRYEDILSTEPAIRNGRLIIDVPEGSTTVSSEIMANSDNVILDSASFELSITAVGDGLTVDPLEGRFLTLNVIKQEDRGLELPYLEDFAGCAVGIFPPESWQQRIVQQNQEQSAEWRCAGSAVVANAFVPESSDQSSSEVWLVSPTFSLSASESNDLSFDLDRRFEPNDQSLVPFDVLISTDYAPGSSFAEASWNRFETGFTAIQNNDPGIDDIENSGLLSLADYGGNNITIAFVYRAGAPGGFDATILRVGNFRIQ